MKALRPKCLICNKACRKNQKYLQCDVCKNLVHRKCSNLSVTDIYKHDDCNIPFYCQKCNDFNYPLSNENDIDSVLNISNSGVQFNCGVSLDPDHLNNVFSTLVDDELNDNIRNRLVGLQPIPDKYYNAENIPFNEFESTTDNQISDKFSSIGINIRSLANTKNFSKFQAFIETLCFSPSVIAINETYLRDNNPGPHCDINGYTFISNCRKSHKGGGVGLYIRDFINFEIREDLTVMDDKIFESLFIEIKCVDKSIIFGTIYRSPSGDSDTDSIFLDYLKTCVSKLRKSKKYCIIQGDFNYNLNDVDDSHMSSFTEVMFDNLFFPHINLPTRITGTSATCIDHIWSNIFDSDVVCGIISETIADHMITFQCSDFNLTQSNNSAQDRKYSKIDYKKLTLKLNDIETRDILQCNDLDTAYMKLEQRVSDSIKDCTENVLPKDSNDQPWFDHELRKLRSKRQRFHKNLQRNRTPNNKLKFDRIDKEYDKLIIVKKKQFNHGRLDKYKKNLKRKWGVINDLLGRKKKENSFSSIYVDGVLVDDKQKIANGFNSFFSEIPKTFHEKLPPMDNLDRLQQCRDFLKTKRNSKFLPKKFINSIFLNPTSPDEIYDIIAKFENKSSCGLDGIPPKVVKIFPERLILCLTHIFNLSLSSGKFVSSFKKSKVVPIHKKKSKSDMNNYRPISLLPVISKILEKIMHTRLYSFLNKKDAFYRNQYGFRPKHSTDQAATVLVDKISYLLNNNMKVATIFLDMSKAFDCVDHQILLQKLYSYGIRGVAHSWFHSYLSGRTQKVMYNGTLSENTCEVKCGVPQGSILGPLLYLIYVNECAKSLNHSNAILYADDTTLVISAKTYANLYKFMNEDLKNLHNWLCLNKLTLNASKTKFIVYSVSSRSAKIPPELSVMIDGNTIERVENYTFLGTNINQHLSWKPHMLNILSKIQRNLGVVRKISRFLDRHSLFQLYHSLIMSHIRNGIVVWFHSHAAIRKKIQACANKFLRIIFHLKSRDSVRDLMKENKLLSVNQIYHLEVAKVMQKYSLKTIPAPFFDIFERQIRTSQTRTRSGSTVVRAPSSTQKCAQSIRCIGPQIWNALPNSIRFLPSENNDLSNHLPLPLKQFIPGMKKYAIENVPFH